MERPESLIGHPPRTSRRGTSIIVLVVLLMSFVSFSPALRSWAAVAALLLTVVSIINRELQPLTASLLTTLITAVPLLHPVLSKWPSSMLVPVLFLLLLTIPFPSMRAGYQWLRRGLVDQKIFLLIAVVSTVSAVALYLWERTLSPDLSVHLAYFPAVSAWLLPLAGLAFSIGNAAMEEFVFRGVFMHSFDSAFGPGTIPVAIQAWLFGAMHYQKGFPNGLSGLVLAVVYGLMLGALRRRAQGMLAPWLAHTAADLAIFIILAERVTG